MEINKELNQDELNLDCNSENDSHVSSLETEQPEEEEEENLSEQFNYSDNNTQKSISLHSRKLNVIELASLAFDFLGLNNNEKKTKLGASYLQ